MPSSPTLTPRPYLLHNRIQPYDWGTRGHEAFIPRLLGIEPEPGQPYAELWIGAHPSAPSAVLVEGASIPLSELIARNPAGILGPAAAHWGTLPFLLKVLSAGRALSIQVHPNLAQARWLHARDPQHYGDANHKPEVAVALGSLTALAGFKSLEGIVHALARIPELGGFLGPDLCRRLEAARGKPYAEQQAAVRALYAALVERSGDNELGLQAALDRLAHRLRGSAGPLQEAEDLFLELRQEYPGADIGLFTLFLLNLVHLQEGQGLYIPAGVPHAYIRGNIVECMAASDNVVRAGLTTKLRDVAVLADILTYDLGPLPTLKGPAGAAAVEYGTPTPEFRLARWDLAPAEERCEEAGGRVQILLVTRGQIRLGWAGGTGAEDYRQGQAVLIPGSLGEYRIGAAAPAQVFKAEVPPSGGRAGHGPECGHLHSWSQHRLAACPTGLARVVRRAAS